jgi:hypothetical protein
MRKTIRASVLILALAMPAFAGEIPYGITSTPTTDTTTQGDMQNSFEPTDTVTDTIEVTVLTFMQTVLALS